MSNISDTTSMCLVENFGIDVLVWQIGAFLFPIFGIPGHILMILTMCNLDRQRFHPTCLYYIFIAISETIYLIFFFWDWLDAVNLAPDPRKVLNCAYFYPFVGSTALISLILIALLNIDRVHMIMYPQRTHSKITNKRVLIKIFLTYTIAIFFVIHYRYSLKYYGKAFIIFGQACQVHDYAHVWFYSVWPYINLLCRLIPCLMIFICTSYICCNRCQKKHDSRARRKQQTSSLLLVFVSIYTLFAVIPITILQLFNLKMKDFESDALNYQCRRDVGHRAEIWKFLNALFIMLEASTYMNKFYVKWLFSPEFRRNVKQMVRCRSLFPSRSRNSL
ncbi:unnamed protein product [Adineta ricciae]|uniref:G-protein coupled receptors family 1 profile domain-containing protein n=1 Tax=Adineta ricciae TaxID=249248 RepID=A0A814HIB3_ADIRI|nr:unnamed protein product [Adineta ricciae]CAF1011396.1 unnamed protein product [Adineta ricciae]